MPNRRPPHPDHVHFAPGLAGTLRWMGYWAASRSTNAQRALLHRWRSRLRPALIARSHTLRGWAVTALRRSEAPPAVHAYESLADAVHNRKWVDAQG
jgi:hypothetical protein